MAVTKYPPHTAFQLAARPGLRRLGSARTVIVLAISLCYYHTSIYLTNMYYAGDRRTYNTLYSILSISDFSEILDLQKQITGSGEFLYGVTIWTASRYLPNDIFLSIVNAIMCAMIVVLLMRHRAPWWLIALIMTNFYLIVLITSAERLKFSIFMLLAAALVRRRASKIFFLAVAPLFHVQTLIFYLSVLAGTLFEKTDFQRIAKRINKPIFIGASTAGLGAIFLWKKDYIMMKVAGYSDSQGDIMQIAMLTAVSVLTFKRVMNPTISIIALWLPVLVLGGARVNMVGCIVYFYYCIHHHKLRNEFLAALSLYFSYKSIGFVQNILEYGDGFVK